MSPRKSQSLMKENPSSTRRQRARTEVISCRHIEHLYKCFRLFFLECLKGAPASKQRGTSFHLAHPSRVISVRQDFVLRNVFFADKGGCQQLCFATTGCAGFTFYEGRKKKCMLFHHCKGERGRCTNCIR